MRLRCCDRSLSGPGASSWLQRRGAASSSAVFASPCALSSPLAPIHDDGPILAQDLIAGALLGFFLLLELRDQVHLHVGRHWAVLSHIHQCSQRVLARRGDGSITAASSSAAPRSIPLCCQPTTNSRTQQARTKTCPTGRSFRFRCSWGSRIGSPTKQQLSKTGGRIQKLHAPPLPSKKKNSILQTPVHT